VKDYKIIIPSSPRLDQLKQVWENFGQHPPHIDPTLEGEESVWNYSRPPSLQKANENILVKTEDTIILETNKSVRVCETASAPSYYVAKEDFLLELTQEKNTTYCEWKGKGTYWSIEVGGKLYPNFAWSYESPYPEYEDIKGLISFYPATFETYLNKERVRAQPGGFYGGWVTDKIKGPIKGEIGSKGW
jgi:uncharacterized protein (DUF427 family)